MAKKLFPDFYKALMDQSAYPSASKKIKYEETLLSYIFKTGEHVYKIRKDSHLYSGLAVKEIYTREAAELGNRWSPELDFQLIPLIKTASGHHLKGPGPVQDQMPGEAVDYALRINQISDAYWLKKLIDQKKINPGLIGKLARYLADKHTLQITDSSLRDEGRPEHFLGLFEDIFYQVKKYTSITISAPMQDMISRPAYRYIEESRKLFQRRQKKGLIIDSHGAFIPEHIHIKGNEIHSIGQLDGQHKFRVLDVANDVACLINEMTLLDHHEEAVLFLKRYVAVRKDRDLSRMLPIYQILQAMRAGLLASESLTEPGMSEAEKKRLQASAQQNFNLAVVISRDLGRTD